MVDKIVGLRIIFESTTININTLNTGQAYVREVHMKTLAEHMYQGRVIVPSLKNAQMICKNIAVINRTLSKLEKKEIPLILPDGLMPPTCFWVVDRNSEYFDEICKKPKDFTFETYWQHIQKCLTRIELKSGQQQEKTLNNYASTLIGIIYVKYDEPI